MTQTHEERETQARECDAAPARGADGRDPRQECDCPPEDVARCAHLEERRVILVKRGEEPTHEPNCPIMIVGAIDVAFKIWLTDAYPISCCNETAHAWRQVYWWLPEVFYEGDDLDAANAAFDAAVARMLEEAR